jgi:hypothetical protein
MGYLYNMTKNQQIKDCIGNIIVCLRQLQTIISDNEAAEKPYYPLDDFKTASGNPPKVNPANRDVITQQKEERTDAINQLCREAAKHNQEVLKNWDANKPKSKTQSRFSYGNSFLPGSLHRIHDTVNFTYYKITKGDDTGAVVRFSKRTGLLDFDGRFVPNKVKRPNHLAIVSNDADGRRYVRNVVRQSKVGRIYRIYRPKGAAGHFTHCDVYKKVSY